MRTSAPGSPERREKRRGRAFSCFEAEAKISLTERSHLTQQALQSPNGENTLRRSRNAGAHIADQRSPLVRWPTRKRGSWNRGRKTGEAKPRFDHFCPVSRGRFLLSLAVTALEFKPSEVGKLAAECS